MNDYEIIREKTKNGWIVIWDGQAVFKDENPDTAEWTSHSFADGLERGITGQKNGLYSNSKIKIVGWYDYLGTDEGGL